MTNFDAAVKWNDALQQYNESIKEVLSYYCSLLHPLITHKECYTFGSCWCIIDNYDNDIEIKITENGMIYSKNGMDYVAIPCEYSLPTADEIIEELGLERVNAEPESIV